MTAMVAIIPAEIQADFRAWLRRYGRELLELPSGEMIVSEPRVSGPGRSYDPERGRPDSSRLPAA